MKIKLLLKCDEDFLTLGNKPTPPNSLFIFYRLLFEMLHRGRKFKNPDYREKRLRQGLPLQPRTFGDQSPSLPAHRFVTHVQHILIGLINDEESTLLTQNWLTKPQRKWPGYVLEKTN
jgi:hypothetical protein